LEKLGVDRVILALFESPHPLKTEAEYEGEWPDGMSDEEAEKRLAFIFNFKLDMMGDPHPDLWSDSLVMQAEWLYDVSRGTEINEATRKWEWMQVTRV
jgi:hypothetical protein